MTCARRNDTRWCCRHKWTLNYVGVVVTAELVLNVLQTRGVL